MPNSKHDDMISCFRALGTTISKVTLYSIFNESMKILPCGNESRRENVFFGIVLLERYEFVTFFFRAVKGYRKNRSANVASNNVNDC